MKEENKNNLSHKQTCAKKKEKNKEDFLLFIPCMKIKKIKK